MEVSNSNNAAIAAFQSNVAATANTQQTRVDAPQQAEQSTPAPNTEVSISEEAQTLFRAEQNPAPETAQLQSGDLNGDKPK